MVASCHVCDLQVSHQWRWNLAHLSFRAERGICFCSPWSRFLVALLLGMTGLCDLRFRIISGCSAAGLHRRRQNCKGTHAYGLSVLPFSIDRASETVAPS